MVNRDLREKVDTILGSSAEPLLEEIIDLLVTAAEQDGIANEDLTPKAIMHVAFHRMSEHYKSLSDEGHRLECKLVDVV